MCGILAYPVPISSYSPPRQHWKPRAIITVKSGNLVDTGGAVTQLLSHFWLLGPHRLEPTRLLCSWGFSGKNIGVGCHFLLQGIFPTQGSNSCLLHWQLDSLPLSHRRKFSSVQSLSRVWLCDSMDCSKPGFLVHHQLPELTQIHVHLVGDAIQPPRPLSSSSPPAFNLSQHQSLFKWVISLHQVLEFQHQSFKWIFRTHFF